MAVVSVGILYSVASATPAPNSFWSRWNGVRLVGIVILMPACVFGLFLSLLDPAVVLVLGAFAVTLMVGAGLGEVMLGLFGWPILGAFAGSITFVTTLFGALVVFARKGKPELARGQSKADPPPRL
jgi:hypothetical protein